jgi:SAM-dependent methyltransferase
MGSFEKYLEELYVFNQDLGCWSRADADRFDYSDGDEVENNILSIIRQAKDLSSTSFELGEKCIDWPTTYHLSSKRSCLLRPVKGVLKGRILEIGAGLGAITRFLGEQGGEVLALEGSIRRASAIRARCRDLDNVTVLAEAFHQFNVVGDFDVIVLVGVLEYARKFFSSGSGDPVDMMLKHARSLLRPRGILILAIENQLGLKYFAGSPEDHTGISMYGIEDLYDVDTVVTFGQKELQERLSLSGFPSQNWWFPFPDYKLPVTVLSSLIKDNKADFTPLLAHSVGADMQIIGGKSFSLEQAWGVVFRNGLAPSLANSFLVLASDVEESVFPKDNAKVLGYYFSMKRRPEFIKEMVFEDVGGKKVEVKKAAVHHTTSSLDDNPISMELMDEEFLEGLNWQSQLCRILNKPGWSFEDIERWAMVWYDAMLNYGNISVNKGSLSSTYLLSGDLFDAIPRNLIITKDKQTRFFDQEWRLKTNIELGYLMFRGIYLELISITNIASPAKNTSLNIFNLFQSVALSLGISITVADLERYAALESNVLYWVAGLKSWLSPQELLERSLIVRLSTVNNNMEQENALNLRRKIRTMLSRPINFLRRFQV